MAKIYRRDPNVNLQIAAMRSLFPNFRYYKSQQYWIGYLQPSEDSPIYQVKIKYRGHSEPEVTILNPKIEKAKHRYSKGKLCLFYPDDPKNMKWTKDSLIAKTIVPWTAVWLFCHEHWLETGVWLNEEVDHNDSNKE